MYINVTRLPNFGSELQEKWACFQEDDRSRKCPLSLHRHLCLASEVVRTLVSKSLFKEVKKEKQEILGVVGKEGEIANEALIPSS